MNPATRTRFTPTLLAALLVGCASLAIGPRCGGGTMQPPAMVEDGTEVNGSSWFQNGFNFRDRIGRRAQARNDLGLRFKTPDLNQGQTLAYARIVLPVTGDGTVTSQVKLRVDGFALDFVPFFSAARPSAHPKTVASAPWVIPANWPGFTEGQTYSCVPLRRYSPDVTAIVNEILARPGWGTGPEKNVGLVILDDNPAGNPADNFVTTQDTAGYGSCSNQHAARLEVYETVADTFLGGAVLGRVTDTSVTANAWSLLPVDVFFEWGTSPGVYTGSTAPVSYAPQTTIEPVLAGLLPDTRYTYRMRFRRTGDPVFDAGPEREFHTQRPPASAFTFAVQADSHLQNRLKDNDVAGIDLYEQTLANLLGDMPDFVVDLGDTFHTEFIQGRNAADLSEALHRHLDQRPYLSLLPPTFVVIGNHEGELGWERNGTAENLAVWSTKARQQLHPNPLPDAFYTGDLSSEPFVGQRESYYAFEWGDALFVALDPFWHTVTRPHDLGGPGSGDRWDWTLGAAQHAWLEQTLQQSSARFKFVFTHQLAGGITDYGRGGITGAKHAIGGDGSYEWGGEDPDGSYVFGSKRPGWSLPVHDLLAANDVAILFTGHDHVFVREDLDDVVYLQMPQPSNASYNLGFPENAQNYLGTRFANSGHVRVQVADTRVDVEYVRAFNPGDGTNGMVEVAFTLFDCNRNGVMDSEEGIVCECQDGIDNDADLLVDFPVDLGCSAAEDISEDFDCEDGLDNDGDAQIDLVDPGCFGVLDGSELNLGIECDDGVDNDADTLVDLADPECADSLDPSEAPDAVLLYVADDSAETVFVYDDSGVFVTSFALAAGNEDPRGATHLGSVYVLDGSDRQVYRYSTLGSFEAVSVELRTPGGGALPDANGMAIDGDDLWVVSGDTQSGKLHRYSLAAAFVSPVALPALQEIDLIPANAKSRGLAIDGTHLFVLDQDDDRFYRYTRAGAAAGSSNQLRTVASGPLDDPSGARIEGASFWIVDSNLDLALRYLGSGLVYGGGGGFLPADQQFGLAAGNGDAQGL